MDRAEHLAWAKTRALEYVDLRLPAMAIASMVSDLRKHRELESSAEWGALQIMLDDNQADAVRTWIEGFE